MKGAYAGLIGEEGHHFRVTMLAGCEKGLRKEDKLFRVTLLLGMKQKGRCSPVNKLLRHTYLGGNMNASNRSARAFSSEATTRKMSLIESIPRNSPSSSRTTR